MGNFYVIEGMDCTGKTSTGKQLSAMSNSIFLDTPLGCFSEIKSEVHGKPYDVRLLFFLSANLDVSHAVRKLVEKNNVICCRYYYSTVVDYCVNTGKSLEQVLALISQYNFLEPKKVILLTVSEDERIKRMMNRGENTLHDEIGKDKRMLENVTILYKKLADMYNWITIDTSETDIKENAKSIHDIIFS